VGSLVCLVLPWHIWRTLPTDTGLFTLVTVQVPTVFWMFCFLFCIRGYSVHGNSLFIHRLIWSTRISLAGLESIDCHANPFHKSILLIGNPGMFGVSGLFYSRRLRYFRAFVTNRADICVLHFTSGPVVISPQDRRHFLTAVLDSTFANLPLSDL